MTRTRRLALGTSIFAVVLSCAAANTRPATRPFPLASFDTLVGQPNVLIDSARSSITRLGMQVAAVSAREGYLETRWFDARSRTSHRYNTNPEHLVRLRVWTDLVTPKESQVVVEAVSRSSVDPSVPDRELEIVSGAGDSLTSTVRTDLKKAFPAGGKVQQAR